MREIRMLRATWRGLETWHGRDASANWRASPRPYRERPFFVPSPAIRFPERKGSRDRNASTAWRLAALAALVFRSAPVQARGRL